MREFHPCMRFIRKYEHSVRIYVVPLQSQTKQDIFMGKGKRLPLDEYTKIIIPSEQYKLASDTRILIPFTNWGKIGFANRDGSIVVEPQFSCYHGECYQKDDLVKVGIIESYGYSRCEGKVSAYHHTLYGLIDYQGKIILNRKVFRVYRLAYAGHDIRSLCVQILCGYYNGHSIYSGREMLK